MYKFADSRIRRTWTPISEREYKYEKDEWRKKNNKNENKHQTKKNNKNQNGTFFIEQQKYRSR